jgi:hypothetical protein
LGFTKILGSTGTLDEAGEEMTSTTRDETIESLLRVGNSASPPSAAAVDDLVDQFLISFSGTAQVASEREKLAADFLEAATRSRYSDLIYQRILRLAV